MDIIKYPIKPEKEKTWHYKSHPYFTKQAANVVREYIAHFSHEGETVLDPFCGTGVTAIEALALKRKVIALDLNPLACFITEWTCRHIDLDKFYTTFYDLESNVKPRLLELETLSTTELDTVPLEYWYPQDVPLPKNADFTCVEELFSRRQLISHAILLAAIQQLDDESMRQMMRYVFSANLSRINLMHMPGEKNGKQVGGGGPSVFGKYRYWRPKLPRELPVWKNFAARFKLVAEGKKKWQEQTCQIDINANLTVINGSILDLSHYISPSSVDYIYTDPPYGGNIAYLDLSTMWNAWLGFPVDERAKQAEVIEGGDLDKSQADYEALFAQSFVEMGKVLKKDGWLSLVFAHKKLEFWNLIIASCEENGLEFKGSVYQPTNNSSMHYKANPANVLCSQRIASFQKTFAHTARAKPADIKSLILNEIEQAYLKQQGAPIDVIYQRVLDQLLK